jgi:putative hydrolase of the HAD superfamily
MTIRAIVFDLFHTLTGSESEWSDLPLTSHVLGIDRRIWNDLLMRQSRWRLAGEETDPIVIISTLARMHDPRIRDEVIRRAVDVRVRRFREAFDRIPPENIETMKRLRSAGFKLGLISNADVMEMAPWADCALAECFDAVTFSCVVGHVKPEPAIYAHCLTALGLEGSECMFVGDGGSNELEGARTAGMTPVFISGVMEELWPELIPERLAQAEHHIRRIPEVLALVGLEGVITSRR